MRKLYLTLLTASLLTSVTFGQRKIGTQLVNPKISSHPVLNGPAGGTADCDTLNYPFPASWNPTAYYADDGNGNIGGFISGDNVYGDMQKANFFNTSTSSYTYITGASIFFAVANTNTPANLSKNVLFKVYSDASGKPGTQVGATLEVPLSSIKNDVDNGTSTEIVFPGGIQIPAAKKFYVSVDVSNFSWDVNGIQDSVCLYQTDFNDGVTNSAWEQWNDNTWHSFKSAWGANAALLILPHIANSAAGCEILPVTLLSFTSQRNNNDVTLKWTIADEIGMKGYEVQKAGNNGAYTTVANVTALNNAKNQAYSVTDKNAFSNASTVQYRLKQIDGDGSVKYSKVLQVKSTTVINDAVFANPFSGALKLNLNLATAQKVSVFVFDMQGKLVASSPQKMYNASVNSITVEGTSNIKPGLYSVKIIAGEEQKVYKIMKQ